VYDLDCLTGRWLGKTRAQPKSGMILLIRLQLKLFEGACWREDEEIEVHMIVGRAYTLRIPVRCVGHLTKLDMPGWLSAEGKGNQRGPPNQAASGTSVRSCSLPVRLLVLTVE
jgi:hypothetical protein